MIHQEMAEAMQKLASHQAWGMRACKDKGNLFSAPASEVRELQFMRIDREREAKALCRRCPVLKECAAYALGGDGWWEPHGVWGATTRADRVRARARRRRQQATAGDGAAVGGGWQPTTVQQRAVLAACSRWDPHTDEALVCAATGLDSRTVRWQYAAVATLMGLDKDTVTWGQWRKAAHETGLDLESVVPPLTPATPAGAGGLPSQPSAPEPGTHTAPKAGPVQAALFDTTSIPVEVAA